MCRAMAPTQRKLLSCQALRQHVVDGSVEADCQLHNVLTPLHGDGACNTLLHSLHGDGAGNTHMLTLQGDGACNIRLTVTQCQKTRA
jgi:hypothetical protein